ncbi:hypothetical protein AOLI_G00127230 [Acnodon oligacanthus]
MDPAAKAIIIAASQSGTSEGQICPRLKTVRNITIEISNHSTTHTLTNPRSHTRTGCCSDPPQPTIKKYSKAVCSFSSESNDVYGVLTYQIFENEKGCVGELAIMFFVPYSYSWAYITSGYCFHPPQPTIAINTTAVCAFSKTARVARGAVGVLTYQILADEKDCVGELAIMFSVPFDYNRFKNWFGLNIYEPDIPCDEELQLSTAHLARTHTTSACCFHPPQPTIEKNTREVCSFSKTTGVARGAVGVLTYQILTNEEHASELAIMFSVPFNFNWFKNWFALGIFEPDIPCDNALFNQMYYDTGLFTRGKSTGNTITHLGEDILMKGTMSAGGPSVMKVEFWDA